MNTKKFKAMLFSCVIGIAGCNKIGNTSYMDGGGDKKDKKKQEAEASFSVVPSVDIITHGSNYSEALEDTINDIKSLADAEEQLAFRKQEAAERAIKAAADAKSVAEMTRRTADDREKARIELGGGDASTSREMDSTSGTSGYQYQLSSQYKYQSK